MIIDYVPLLQIQRDIQHMPKNRARFTHYLRTIMNDDGTGPELAPLLAANPMAKEHVTKLIDDLLALDADGIAVRAIAEASAELAREPGTCKAGLVIVDDLKGGWTNRYANEFTFRFQCGPATAELPRWLKHFWIGMFYWSSAAPSEQLVREAVLAPVYRAAYLRQHGPARTLRDMLAQEGHVMARAGCVGPMLDDEDIDYTREVLVPFLDATDKRTCMECLFGDVVSRTLGFTPRGLSPWAGLALALHDARVVCPASHV